MLGMQPKIEAVNTTLMAYPCYVGPVLSDSKAIYIPGEGILVNGEKQEIKGLEKIYSLKYHILEGYLRDNIFYIYDCLTIEEWDTKTSEKEYRDRLVEFRSIINGVLADYSHFRDLPLDPVDDVGELMEIYKKILTNGNEGAIIRSSEGYYAFEGTSDDFIEFRRRGKS